MSYGFPEEWQCYVAKYMCDEEGGPHGYDPVVYLTRANVELAKLALLGVSACTGNIEGRLVVDLSVSRTKAAAFCFGVSTVGLVLLLLGVNGVFFLLCFCARGWLPSARRGVSIWARLFSGRVARGEKSPGTFRYAYCLVCCWYMNERGSRNIARFSGTALGSKWHESSVTNCSTVPCDGISLPPSLPPPTPGARAPVRSRQTCARQVSVLVASGDDGAGQFATCPVDASMPVDVSGGAVEGASYGCPFDDQEDCKCGSFSVEVQA